jgi:fermentation-respiration switch protein FrsA (DUF1100 family)
VLAAAAVLVGLAAFIAIRAYRTEAKSDSARMAAGPVPSKEIRELSLWHGLPAWYVPSRNGAAILYVHGWGASRDQLWPEAREAASKGYGALLIDLPFAYEQGADWASAAKLSVEAGVAFLEAQPGLQHLGAQAFSSGCAVLLQAVAGDPRIEAVALLSPYTNAREHLDYEYRRWGPLAQWPARAGARRAGYRVEELDSLQAVTRLAGRPVLVVAGDADTIVPLEMSKRLFAAAREPKRFWLVQGAGHGDYGMILGDRFYAGLSEFFDASLSGSTSR